MVKATEKNRSEHSDFAPNPKPVRLSILLEGLTYTTLSVTGPEEIVITSVTANSREVETSSLFTALVGINTDGHLFLDKALAKGCVAVLVEESRVDTSALARAGICVIGVEDSRAAYATIAANFYGHPAREMTLVGITGTNGKTTITYLLEHILEKRGIPVGVIGTVNYRYSGPEGKKEIPAPFTTPEPLLLQRLLRTMADAGVRYVVMEASSHALAQSRLGSIHFDVAAFTNLSHDHLDYHKDMEHYFKTKVRLFTDHLKTGGTAVITHGEGGPEHIWQIRLGKVCREKGIATRDVGYGDTPEIRLIHADSRRDGTTIMVETAKGGLKIDTPMVGKFNVENIVTTLGICQALGVEPAGAAELLAIANGAPGRLQRVEIKDDLSRPIVFVDYAHTPDALCKVLATLEALPHRNLICVFGCGGDRDSAKRPIMGAIAAKTSDVVIVTDDNPRSEASSQIIEQILPGIKGSGYVRRDISWLRRRDSNEKGFLVLPVREEAIEAAVKTAITEDIVLIAGKGHEKYQLGPSGKRFFDDVLEAQQSLIAWNCTSVGKAVGGDFAGELNGPCLGSVSTDSRKITKGDIFVALQGETFDGHNFIPQVLEAGAGCLVVSRQEKFDEYRDIPRFLVQDTQQALGDLAAYRRRLLRSISRPLVIGLTGSCGKTTVKEMTALIFERQWPRQSDEEKVLKTKGNFNNLIGLPISLLPLGVKHKAAILEMGMNRPGEIASLTRIADPDISCIVSIHPAHLEGLHSIAGVAAAKEELFAGISEKGILAINLDDEFICAMAEKYGQRKVTYSAAGRSSTREPDLWASEIRVLDSGSISYVLHRGNDEVEVDLKIPGAHNVSNSLAAAAMATAAGCSLETISKGLADFHSGDKRLVLKESPAGLKVIDDTYNANPGSMVAGLKTLDQLGSGTTMAILGDMLELGEASASSHFAIGKTAAGQGVTFLALYGQFAEDTKAGALSAGMVPDAVQVFETKDEIASWVRELGSTGKLKKGDWLLLKASRGMRFETIVDELMLCS